MKSRSGRRQNPQRRRIVASAETQRGFDRIAQLANVSGPRVVGDRRSNAAVSIAVTLIGLAESRIEEVYKMSDEEPEVFRALAQRRGAYHPDREAIVQILAQLALAHRLLGFAVGRGDDAHVDRNLARPTDRTNAALLNRAQQLGLRLGTHFGYFVEEQSAALRRAKQAELLLVGAAECAPARNRKVHFR